jgi:hypothetical protein
VRAPFFAALLSASIAWTPLSSALTAQQVTDRQTAFESLADSQWVRLAVPDIGRHEGRLLERSSEVVVLSAEAEPLRVRATTVDTLWTGGNAGRTGATVGAWSLVLSAPHLGPWHPAMEENCPGTAAKMLLMGGIGLAGGAVLGGLTGLAAINASRDKKAGAPIQLARGAVADDHVLPFPSGDETWNGAPSRSSSTQSVQGPWRLSHQRCEIS